jgi:hypothetical protein
MDGRSADDMRRSSMLTHWKSSVAWQVTSGFVLGIVGIVTMQPADATRTLVGHIAPHAVAR